MEKSRASKIIIITAIVIVCLAIIALAAVVIYRQTEVNRINRAYELETQELRVKKAELLSKYNRLEAEYIDAVGTKGTLSYVFIDLDPILYNTVYPMFNEGETPITGILCFTPDDIPGMQDRITMAEYEELIAHGWGRALFFESDVDAEGNEILLSDWLSDMRAALGAAGLSMPDTLVMGRDLTHTAELDATLLSNGIEHVVHYGSDDYPLIETTAGEGVWHPGACGWLTSGVTSVMYDSVKRDGGHFVFAVGFNRPKYGNENYGPDIVNVVSQFERMLIKIKSSSEGGDLIIYSSLDEAKQYRSEYNTLVEAAKAQASVDRVALQEQINETDRALLAIYNKYYG